MPTPSSRPLPLAGVRVLDIASLYAAPLASTLLADFGAEVIKVEPPEGDGFRGTGMWPQVARNKKSITLDLRQPEGCEVLKQLVEQSDVLVENYPAAVLQRRGIAWADLSARNGDLVMVSISCFGHEGPYAPRPGSGTIGEGFAGLTHLTGPQDGAPMLPSFALGDTLGAMSAVIGTLTALYWRDGADAGPRERGHPRGRGQQIDATLFEPVLFAISQAAARWQPGASPTRMGSRLPPSAVRNVYGTRDGRHVVISASTPRHVLDLVRLAGGTEAQANFADADPLVARWIAGIDQAALLEQLVAARIPVAPVNDIDALLADPHVAARGSLTRLDDPELGPLALVQPAPRLAATPGSVRWVNPALGQHNDEVYAGLLQLDAQRLAALKQQRVI